MEFADPSTVPAEPLHVFECQGQGFDIVVIPHSEEVRARLTLEADKEGVSLALIVKEQIMKALIEGLVQ